MISKTVQFFGPPCILYICSIRKVLYQVCHMREVRYQGNYYMV